MYILEITSSSGGCNKGDHYVYPKLEEVWNALREDLANTPYMLLCYGEEILLHRIEKDGITTLNMHRYITITWKGQDYRTDDSGIVGVELGGSDSENDEEHCDTGMLFYSNGLHDVAFRDQDIVYNNIPLIIHLNLPILQEESLYPVPPGTFLGPGYCSLPTEIGYHNYE